MKAFMTVTGKDGPPSFEEAARQLSVAVEAIDREFGMVPLDPAAGTYTVMVEAEKPSTGEEPITYSNPPIEPFGGPAGGSTPKKKQGDHQ